MVIECVYICKGLTGGGRGQSAPDTFHWKVLLTRKQRKGKKGKWTRKEGKLQTEEGRRKILLKYGSKKGRVSRGLLFFSLSLNFLKPLKFCLGSTKMEIATNKKFFMPGKIRKSDLAPLKNITLTPLFICDTLHGS